MSKTNVVEFESCGRKPTKRGSVVLAKWQEMTKIPARKIEVGMTIDKSMVVTNVDFHWIAGVTYLETACGQSIQFTHDENVSFVPTNRQREDMIIELILFRESLLKSGLPRKKRCKRRIRLDCAGS
jgi:hypothetical protein